MDVLNAILWLKCRTTWRQLPAGRFGRSVGVVLSAFFAYVLVFEFFVSYFYLEAQSVHAARLSLHAVLTLLFVLWLVIPMFDHRFGQFTNLGMFRHYPIRPETVLFSSLLASFFDVNVLVLVPLLMALTAWSSSSVTAMVLSVMTVFIYLLVVMCLGFFTRFSLRWLMSRPPIMARLVVLLLLIATVLVTLFFLPESYVDGVLDGGLRGLSSPDNLEFLASLNSLLPSGMTAEALCSFSAGRIRDGLLWGTALFLTALLCLRFVAEHVERLYGGRYDYMAASKASGWLSRLVSGLPGIGGRFSLVGRGVISAVVQKDLKLLLREPSFLLAFAVLAVFLSGLACRLVFSLDYYERDGLFFAMIIVMFFLPFALSGLFLNGLSLDRGGLRRVVTAPVSIFSYMAGKNIAVGLVLSLMFLSILVLACLVKGTSNIIDACFFVLLFVCSVLVTGGLGNIVSVCVPVPLPASGFSRRRQIGGLKVFALSVASSLMTMLSGMFIGPVLMIQGAPCLLLSLSSSEHTCAMARYVFVAAAPFSLMFALGVWGIGTGVAVSIFQMRQEKLFEEIVD